MFELAFLLSAIVSSGIAAVCGFGIGSIMTPLLALEVELKLAVAIVSIPHCVATVERFWKLRKNVDRNVLISFGITSSGGGLLGAYLNTRFTNPFLIIIFSCLLIFAGISGVSGLAQRMRFGRKFAWMAGFMSGAFGGLVGNQGGIRAAAMLTFGLSPQAFVATSTAIGLAVDLARMPIYFASDSARILAEWRLLSVGVAGVVIGTTLGTKVLSGIPKDKFQRIVSFLILLLGLAMLNMGISRV